MRAHGGAVGVLTMLDEMHGTSHDLWQVDPTDTLVGFLGTFSRADVELVVCALGAAVLILLDDAGTDRTAWIRRYGMNIAERR